MHIRLPHRSGSFEHAGVRVSECVCEPVCVSACVLFSNVAAANKQMKGHNIICIYWHISDAITIRKQCKMEKEQRCMMIEWIKHVAHSVGGPANFSFARRSTLAVMWSQLIFFSLVSGHFNHSLYFSNFSILIHNRRKWSNFVESHDCRWYIMLLCPKKSNQ